MYCHSIFNTPTLTSANVTRTTEVLMRGRFGVVWAWIEQIQTLGGLW